MPFTPGEHVHIASFGKGIVQEVRNGGQYLVVVKGRSMVVQAGALTAVERNRRRDDRHGPTAPSGVPDDLARAHARSFVDLHGKTTAEAVGALDELVNDAILAGLGEVQVIHGRGRGRLKAAIHQRLKQLPPVRGFRVDPGNPGVTIVSLG
jgi:DNA mismatch repair protein MutS2